MIVRPNVLMALFGSDLDAVSTSTATGHPTGKKRIVPEIIEELRVPDDAVLTVGTEEISVVGDFRREAPEGR